MKQLRQAFLDALKSYAAAKKRGDEAAMDEWQKRMELLRRQVPHEKEITKKK